MARYIELKKRYKSADGIAKALLNRLSWTLEDTNEFINSIEDADVAEVKHGKWQEHFAFGCWHYDCPFCDDGYAIKEQDKTPPNYCQNCGAKMDGKEQEDVD